MVNFVGIDYGAKLAGTTVICWQEKDELKLVQSVKKKDADLFLTQQIETLHPATVFIDAPLSLPLVYTQPNQATDYFYRQSDKITRAMSPMFLGGLTARAMRLANGFKEKNIVFREIYPSYFVRELLNKPISYKKNNEADLSAFLKLIEPKLPISKLSPTPSNWHQVDAVLAWWSGWRFQHGKHLTLGDEQEGVIVV